jgi:hypothetical protein
MGCPPQSMIIHVRGAVPISRFARQIDRTPAEQGKPHEHRPTDSQPLNQSSREAGQREEARQGHKCLMGETRREKPLVLRDPVEPIRHQQSRR